MEVVMTNIIVGIVGLVFSALSVLAGKALNYLAEKYKLDAYAPEFENILDEALDFGESLAMEAIAKKDIGEIEIENETLANALEYVSNNGPKLAKKLGFSQEQIEDKLAAKLSRL